MRDLDATDDYPTPNLVTIFPGKLRLRFGVISTVGNYREQNEDNFYVPGGFHGRPAPAATAAAPDEHGTAPGPSTPQIGGSPTQ